MISTLPADLDALLERLRAAGVEFWRVGSSLRYRCAPGALTPDLRAAIAAQRSALLTYLTPHPCAGCGRHAFPVPGVTCYWCRRDPSRQTLWSEDA